MRTIKPVLQASTVILITSFMLSGCGYLSAHPAKQMGLDNLLPTETVEDCPRPQSMGMIFWMEPKSFVPGETVSLTPYATPYPGAYDAMPSQCLKRIKVVPANAAAVKQATDGDYLLVIAKDAPLDQPVHVQADYLDKTITNTFNVYSPHKSPLVGYWHQDAASCAPQTVVQELVFSADGTFSVTYQPFESYKDYWGTYSFDPKTGQLDLVVKSGNLEPEGVNSGHVELGDGTLKFATASLGRNRNQDTECHAPFHAR